MFKRKNLKGFTLIELVVVIAIMGILATIGILAFAQVQKKSRDTKRVGDLRSLSQALQLYYADNNSSYPGSLASLAPKYIPAVPTPPNTTLQAAYTYSMDAATNTYAICAITESPSGTNKTWKVSTKYSGGAESTDTGVAAANCPAE